MAIKILRIINRMVIGGPAFNAIYLTNYLPPEFESLLLAGVKEDHEEDSSELMSSYKLQQKVIEISSMKRPINFKEDIKAYKEIKKIIEDFKPDIIHTHAAKPGLLGRLAAYRCKVPIILHTYHGHYFHSYFGKIKTSILLNVERYLATKSTKIIAISQSQKNELAHTFKVCPAEQIAVIPNGIDLTKYSENLEVKRSAWRANFNLSESDILIGIVGRMVEVKNHSFFVKIAERVLELSPIKNIKFIIIGDGDCRTAVQEQLQSLKIPYNYFPENNNSRDSKVVLTSWQTKMDEVYAALDIVCLTSLNEGTPISLIEAQAGKKPIVSTKVGAVEDTIIAEKSAFLVPLNDTDLFATHLLTLVKDPALRDKMGKIGYEFVTKCYSHLRLVKDMGNLYKQLLAETGQ